MIKILLKRSVLALAFALPATVMADYPVGYQDHYVVRAGNDLRMEVLNNDTGDSLSIVESNDWTVKGGRTGSDTSDRNSRERRILYSAPANFVGEDEFWYVLSDNQGRLNAAKVTITVLPADGPSLSPKADEVTVAKNTSIRIDVLNNDGALVSAGSFNNGNIADFNAWSKNGGQIKRVDTDTNTPQLEYTPKPGFVGVDEFWYSMNTGSYTVNTAAKVTINVTEEYSSGAYPQGNPDNITVRGTSSGRYTVDYFPLDNDTGQNLRIVDRSGYSLEGGTYSVRSDGRLKYTPPSRLQNSSVQQFDKIWYVIEDELGRKNWGVINLTIPAFYRG